MSYLREYIRHCLFEEGTCAFGEPPVTYDPKDVLLEANCLKQDFGNLIHKNMNLAYFSKNLESQIDGAAWVGDNGKIFEFTVVTSGIAPDAVFENLVRDCMEEYAALCVSNPKLRLEIKIEDFETENHLSESYGLSILSQNENMAIMGFES